MFNSRRVGVARVALLVFALATRSLAVSNEQQQVESGVSKANFDADSSSSASTSSTSSSSASSTITDTREAATSTSTSSSSYSAPSVITDKRFTPLLPESWTPAPTLTKPPAFTIADDAFHLDGERFTLLSGEIHYFRIPFQYWRDRLKRVRALGFNAVTVYVPWNFHQPDSADAFDFSSVQRNLTRFFDLASEEDLFVVMRPPPYICAEWDFGGLPAWLADPKSVRGGGVMPLRSSEKPEFFLAAVERWYENLLPRLRPYLIENGGPILMVQVENEFGNVSAPDVPYLKALAAMTRRLLDSDEVLLFTTDAPRFVANGSVPFHELDNDPNFVAMVDSGAGWNASDLDATFSLLKGNGEKNEDGINVRGKTPFFSSELYDGWVQFVGVGFEVSNVSVSRFTGRMRGLLERSPAGGGGVSLYMAAGGSNPGFWAGASINTDDDSFATIIQSYDYAAPISEGGSTDKQPGYGGPPRASAVRDVLEKFATTATGTVKTPSSRSASGTAREVLPLPPMPADPPVASYGRVELSQRATLLSLIPQLSSLPSPSKARQPLTAARPLPMELFGQTRGLVSYSTRVPRSALLERSEGGGGPVSFEIGGGGAIHDLGTVLVDGVSQGTLDRSKGVGDGGSRLKLERIPEAKGDEDGGDSPAAAAELTIIVGMTGRSNQGTLFDTKGLNGSVLLDGKELQGEWKVWPLPLDDTERVENVDLTSSSSAAAAASAASAASSSLLLLTVEDSGPLLLRGSFEMSGEQAEAASVGEWEAEEEDENEEEGEKEEDEKRGRRRKRRSHPADTYLSFEGLSRGVAFVNGIALGWYDLLDGPQMRIYVPGVWLRNGRNDVLVLEMISASADAAVESVLEPDFFGPPKEEGEKEKIKKSAAAEGALASAELETSSLLRFPGSGAVRRIEATTTS